MILPKCPIWDHVAGCLTLVNFYQFSLLKFQILLQNSKTFQISLLLQMLLPKSRTRAPCAGCSPLSSSPLPSPTLPACPSPSTWAQPPERSRLKTHNWKKPCLKSGVLLLILSSHFCNKEKCKEVHKAERANCLKANVWFGGRIITNQFDLNHL